LESNRSSLCPTCLDSIKIEFLLEFPNEFDLGRIAKLGAHGIEDLQWDLARRLVLREVLVVKSSGRQTILAPPLAALSIITTPFSRLSSWPSCMRICTRPSRTFLRVILLPTSSSMIIGTAFEIESRGRCGLGTDSPPAFARSDPNHTMNGSIETCWRKRRSAF
jgi:hypothetical protein